MKLLISFETIIPLAEFFNLVEHISRDGEYVKILNSSISNWTRPNELVNNQNVTIDQNDSAQDPMDQSISILSALNLENLRKNIQSTMKFFTQTEYENMKEKIVSYNILSNSKMIVVADNIAIQLMYYILNYLTILKHNEVTEIYLLLSENLLDGMDTKNKSKEELLNELKDQVSICYKNHFVSLDDEKFLRYLLSYIQNLTQYGMLNSIMKTLSYYCKSVSEEYNPYTIPDSLIQNLKEIKLSFNLNLLTRKALVKNEIDTINTIHRRFLLPGFNDEDVFISKNKDEFIIYEVNEQSEEILNFLKKIKNVKALHVESNRLYDSRIIEIGTKLKLYKDVINPINKKFEMGILEALDCKLHEKIEQVTNPHCRDRYLYVSSDNQFINDEILNQLQIRTDTRFRTIEKPSKKRIYGFGSNFLRFNYFSALFTTEQKHIWEYLKKEIFSNGFALFIDKKIPNSLWAKSEIDVNRVWVLTDQSINKNISKIIFSLLNKHIRLELRADLNITNSIEKAIENNVFDFVVEGTDCNLKILSDVIKNFIRVNDVKLYSPIFWYNLKDSYFNANKEYRKIFNGISNTQTVVFCYNEDNNKWDIDGLGKTIEHDNNKQLIIALLGIFKSNIDVIHARTISNYFVNNKAELKIRLNDNEADLHNASSSVSQLIKKISNDKNAMLAKFFQNTLELKDNKIIFSNFDPKSGSLYECKVLHKKFIEESDIFNKKKYINAFDDFLNDSND